MRPTKATIIPNSLQLPNSNVIITPGYVVKKVAEVPLVATRFQYRRLGMCRILMDEFEKVDTCGSLFLPDASPEGKKKLGDDNVRLEDERVPMDEQLNTHELEEVLRAKDAHSRVQVLETVGRMGRAGKLGTTVLMFTNSQRRTLRSIERDIGGKFEFVSPPSVQVVLESYADQVVATLSGVHPESIANSTPTAQKLMDQQGVEALSAALATLSGFSKPPSSRSLMTCQQCG